MCITIDHLNDDTVDVIELSIGGRVSFSVGDLVCVRVDRARLGPVLEVLPPIGDTNQYRVFHSASSTATYAEDQLTRVESTQNGTATGLPGTPVTVEELRARLTAAVLRHPRSDDIYALSAARIEFIPFQFRPLTRLLRADRPRLLIADEVGVGKTIEAGLILKELSARGPMDNVLIACPKSLTYKWQQEMRRFDEHFRIIDAAALKYCLKEARDDGAWPAEYSRAIIHYELLRGTSYLEGDSRDRWPGFLELDPPPVFNLVIADEAHHLRSAGTNSHRMAQYIGEVSEALVLLSATPLQLGSKDLYTLLNLLRPEVFNSPSLFDQMIEPNAFLTRSAHHLRRLVGDDDWRTKALEELDNALGTPWGRRALSADPRVTRVRTLLSNPDAGCDDHTRVQCLHDVQDLNTLGHVMNRTRRRDIGRFTTREPLTVKAPFTMPQRRFYNALLDSRREILESRYSSTVVRLILDSLERQASSCLPALARSVDRLVADGKLSATVFSDDPELQSDDEPSSIADPVSTKLVRIADLARALPDDEDPKLDRLMAIIENTRNGDGPGKLLLFSFFLDTLGYLAEKVQAIGLRVGVVTGRVPDEEREALRLRFKLPSEDENAIDLLMSSEVGCEGLDYQFCDRMVNYDIPWNPMRVEQRIGRIDRFGQQSEKVLIYNFITPDTVEDRIYFRCWERLGVFRDAIGDLESVLGNTVEQLNQIAMDRALSPEQATEQARQVADNVLRRADEDRRLEESAPELLGFSQIADVDADSVDTDGRFVTPAEIEHLVARFLSLNEIGGEVHAVAESPRLRQLSVPRAEGRARILEYLAESAQTNGRAMQDFARWARGDSSVIACTFDQRQAVEDRSVDFITPLHPIVRAAINAVAPPADMTMATHLTVVNPDLPAGTYLFAMDTWEIVAVRPGVRTAYTVVPLSDGSAAEMLERSLSTVLPVATAGRSELPDQDLIQACMDTLGRRQEARRRADAERIREENSILLERRLASLAADHEARMAALAEQVTGATNPKIARMRDGQRTRLTANYQSTLNDLESRRDVDVLATRLCTGILEVHNA